MTHFILATLLNLLPFALDTYTSYNDDFSVSQPQLIRQLVEAIQTSHVAQVSQTKSKEVYITPKGGRYHYIDCPTLDRSKNVIAISIKKAKTSGRNACRACKPALMHLQGKEPISKPIHVTTQQEKNTTQNIIAEYTSTSYVAAAYTSNQHTLLPRASSPHIVPHKSRPAWQGLCVGVSDGDTITVLKDGKTPIKIRLYGIDTPEKKQAFGMKAKLYTSGLVFQQIVMVQTIDIDRYNREVAIITLPDSSLLQTRILESGMAWVYTKYCSAEFRSEWQALEENSKNKKMGLWQDKDAMPPWQWRKNKRELAKREKNKKLNQQNKTQTHILDFKFNPNLSNKNIQTSQAANF